MSSCFSFSVIGRQVNARGSGQSKTNRSILRRISVGNISLKEGRLFRSLAGVKACSEAILEVLSRQNDLSDWYGGKRLDESISEVLIWPC